MSKALGYSFENGHFTLGGTPVEFSSGDIERMNFCRWWHKIPFAPDVISPGEIDFRTRLPKYFLDKIQFEGRSVLGIGCYEGFALYLAEALGAKKVVGLLDSFGIQPPIDEARKFAMYKLDSKIEWVDKSIYELSSKDLGQFDIVLAFDILLALKHPLLALEKLSSVCANHLFLTSPFVVSDDSMPWCAMTPSFEPEGLTRNYSAPNGPWILRALEASGFKVGLHHIWDVDYLSVAALKHDNPPRVLHVPYFNLPEDRGQEERTAVLIASCQKYKCAWEPFTTLFRRYWPDCPYKVYFGSDFGQIDGFENIELGEDFGWAGNCIKFLERIPAERVLVFQEDFFVSNQVDTTRVRKLAKHAHDYDIGYLRICPTPGPNGRWPATDALGTIGIFDDFRWSFQLSIWKNSLLRSLLKPGENPWVTEFVGARRSIFCKEPFLSVWPKDPLAIPYLTHAIVGGEWQERAINFLAAQGINLNLTSRKI